MTEKATCEPSESQVDLEKLRALRYVMLALSSHRLVARVVPTATMSINHHHHHRSNSAGRSLSPRRASTSSAERSTSPGPTQTFHPHILPRSVPTPALVESAASGAHYAGIKVDGGSQHRANNHEHQRRSSAHNDVELAADHGRVLEDLKEIFSCRATVEIFERSWRKDAVFEVRWLANGRCGVTETRRVIGPACVCEGIC